LPLAGGGQKGFGGLSVQIVRQHIADAAEKFEQNVPTQEVVVLVCISDTCSAHFRSPVGFSNMGSLNCRE